MSEMGKVAMERVPPGRKSVRNEQPPSERLVGNRLTNEDIGRLVLALVSGAPGRQLAEQHGIK